MKQYNCKNCNAPIIHSYNHRCSYCGTLIDFGVEEKETIRVKAEEMALLKLERVERSPFKDSIILYFSGYKCDQPKIYEYNGNDFFVSHKMEYINPPKCGICIELELKEMEQYGYAYIRQLLLASGINLQELERVEYDVIQKLNRYVRVV